MPPPLPRCPRSIMLFRLCLGSKIQARLSRARPTIGAIPTCPTCALASPRPRQDISLRDEIAHRLHVRVEELEHEQRLALGIARKRKECLRGMFVPDCDRGLLAE
jgi:hypothetical protein